MSNTLLNVVFKIIRIIELLFGLFFLIGLCGSIDEFSNLSFWIAYIFLAIIMFTPLIILHRFIKGKLVNQEQDEQIIFSENNIVPSSENIEINNSFTNDEYIESGNIIYRVDGQTISDEEVSYLQQIGQEKARARMMIPQHIRQIQQSYQIMYNTTDPNTLCSRYKYIRNIVKELEYFFQQGYYTDAEKLQNFQELISDTNYVKLIHQCFTRYMNKANAELKTISGIKKRKQKFLDYIRANVDIQILMNLSIF